MLFVTTKKDKLFFFCHPQCLKISRLVYQNFDDQLAIILNWKFWSFFFLLYHSLWLAVQLYKKTTTKKCKTLSDLNIKFQQCDSIKLSKYFSVVGILTCTGISLFLEWKLQYSLPTVNYASDLRIPPSFRLWIVFPQSKKEIMLQCKHGATHW